MKYKLFLTTLFIYIFTYNSFSQVDTTKRKSKSKEQFYFACSSYHGIIQGYCKQFKTHDDAIAEEKKHKKEFPDHKDILVSGGKCPF